MIGASRVRQGPVGETPTGATGTGRAPQFNRASVPAPRRLGAQRSPNLRPGGTPENSPAFQRRDQARNHTSPEGTAESREKPSPTRHRFSRPFGTCSPDPRIPAEVPGYFRMSLRDKRTAGLNPINTVRRNGIAPCHQQSFAWPLGLAPNRKPSNVGRACPSLFPGAPLGGVD